MSHLYTLFLLLAFASTLGASSNKEASYACKAPTIVPGKQEMINNADYQAFLPYYIGVNKVSPGFFFWNDSTYENSDWTAGVHLCSGIADDSGATIVPDRVELSEFDFLSGSATCVYYKGSTPYSCEIKNIPHIRNTISYHAAIHQDLKTKQITDSVDFYKRVGNVIGEQVVPVSQELANKLLNGAEDFDVFTMAAKKGVWTFGENGEEKPSIRVSNFLTGLILMDNDFIKGIDPATREIVFSDEVDKQLSTLIIGDGENIDSVDLNGGLVSFLHNVRETSITDIFNRKAFALYVNFFNVVMDAFSYFAYIMIGLAFGWLILLYGGSAVIKRFSSSQEGRNENLPGKLVGIAIAFALAFMPFPGGVSPNYGQNSEMGLGGSNEHYIDTTVAKNLIAYFGQYGADFANHLSDGIFVVYLEYIANRFSAGNRAMATSVMMAYKKDLILGKAKESFYRTQCEAAYLKGNNGLSNFMDYRLQERSQFMQNIDIGWQSSSYAANVFDISGIFQSSAALGKNSTTVAVSPELCKKVASQLYDTKRILHREGGAIKDLQIWADKDTKTRNESVYKFVNGTLEMQKLFGWINIISLPMLESYMQGVSILGDEVKTRATATTSVIHDYKQGAIQFAAMRESAVQDTDDDELNKKNLEDALSKTSDNASVDGYKAFFGQISGYVGFFMLPGFGEVYKFINDAVTSALNVGTLAIGALAGSLLSGGTATAFAVGGAFVGYVFKPLVAMALSMILAIILYTQMLKTISMVIISMMMLVKIFFFFLDILKYFFVSPFVVFLMTTRQQNTEAFEKYISRGFVLIMLKPLILVVTVSIFIVTYEFLLAIYHLVISLGVETLSGFDKMVDLTDSSALYDSVMNGIMVSSIEPLSTVFYYIFSLFVAYSVIMNGDKWLLGQLGYQDDNASNNEVKDLVNDIKTKLGKQ